MSSSILSTVEMTASRDTTPVAVSLILYATIVILCFVSFWQEREARKVSVTMIDEKVSKNRFQVIRGFEGLLPTNCSVIRDGHETTMAAENLVVGDIIKIKNGTRVPADARIIKCSDLKLETAAITGESEAIEYKTEPVEESVNIFEAHNVAFNSSMCVDGDSLGLVIKTGVDTVSIRDYDCFTITRLQIIGQIATMTTQQGEKKSRLQEQIKVRAD